MVVFVMLVTYSLKSELIFLDIWKSIGVDSCTLVSSFLRTPFRSGAKGLLGADNKRGGQGGGSHGLKREREVADQPQVANQSQVDIIDANHIKNEDRENNEVEVTFESHPRTPETIEAVEAMTKLKMMKQEQRKLELEEEELKKRKQDLALKIEEQRARVIDIAAI